MHDQTIALLPFSLDALMPVVSPRALATHRDEHRGYVEAVESLVLGTSLRTRPLEELARSTSDVLACAATQAWAHDFFWRSLTTRATFPQATLDTLIEDSFGSLDAMRRAVQVTARSVDGPGWLWLIGDGDGDLEVLATPGAGVAVWRAPHRPLLALDLWEHAYAIDYGADRARYVDAMFDLINWDVVGARLGLFASGSG